MKKAIFKNIMKTVFQCISLQMVTGILLWMSYRN